MKKYQVNKPEPKHGDYLIKRKFHIFPTLLRNKNITLFVWFEYSYRLYQFLDDGKYVWVKDDNGKHIVGKKWILKNICSPMIDESNYKSYNDMLKSSNEEDIKLALGIIRGKSKYIETLLEDPITTRIKNSKTKV